jgi:inhibitor of KinA sporulation pathway (predicted exonuclease)
MKNFNLVNVLDTELTCYADGVFPEGEKQEHIHFGLTVVDLRTLQILRTVSTPIIPVMSTVTPFCTGLTGWTKAKLTKQGVHYAVACRRIMAKEGSLNRLLVTDSNGDVTSVREQCKLMGVDHPFGEDHLNVSTLFTLITGQRENLSLAEKLAVVGLKFEGRPHRADVDSFNIARLLVKLLEICRSGLAVSRGLLGPLA